MINRNSLDFTRGPMNNEHEESESLAIKSVLFISPKEQGNDIPLVRPESMTQIKFQPG